MLETCTFQLDLDYPVQFLLLLLKVGEYSRYKANIFSNNCQFYPDDWLDLYEPYKQQTRGASHVNDPNNSIRHLLIHVS